MPVMPCSAMAVRSSAREAIWKLNITDRGDEIAFLRRAMENEYVK